MELFNKMPIKVSTTIRKIKPFQNPVNVELLGEFLDYMRKNGSSERHENNNLKVVLHLRIFLENRVRFMISKKTKCDSKLKKGLRSDLRQSLYPVRE